MSLFTARLGFLPMLDLSVLKILVSDDGHSVLQKTAIPEPKDATERFRAGAAGLMMLTTS